jgi:DMSO/TMAO reductase YedYZ molybdopterin-dependent catalytic subunit
MKNESFSRRNFLTGVATALPLVLSARELLAQTLNPVLPTVRRREPDNYEFPFTLESFWTPKDRFFVSSAFEIIRKGHDWRLQVEGAVSRPFELTYDELIGMPSRTVGAVLEDPGNNRLYTNEPGTPWAMGAVGCAQWTGVPLADVLQKAGIRPEGVEVIIESAEAGEIRNSTSMPDTPGRVNVARSLPVKKVMAGDVLLAYKINNEDLPQQLGGPVRVVVPGWYGCAWVKWPQRIVVSGAPFEGYFQKFDCTVWERRNGFAVLTPITELQPKTQIARPYMNERIHAKDISRIYGAAWTGDAEITQVEVSGDDGKTWQDARLLDSPPDAGPRAWKLWEYQWPAPLKGGGYNVRARATDSRGRVQPSQRDTDRRAWMINHIIPVNVDVYE